LQVGALDAVGTTIIGRRRVAAGADPHKAGFSATFGSVLVGLTLWAAPVQSGLAVLLILMGIPVFLPFQGAKSRQAVARKTSSSTSVPSARDASLAE
jgi:hypothetical protein